MKFVSLLVGLASLIGLGSLALAQGNSGKASSSNDRCGTEGCPPCCCVCCCPDCCPDCDGCGDRGGCTDRSGPAKAGS